ncbi:type II CRISPR-associated endonuclease Cas1 [soil metagenome]
MSGPARLRLQDNALLVSKDGGASGKIPIEDMAFLILDGPEIELTSALLEKCVSLDVAVLTTDGKHLPGGLLLPLAGHSLHSATLRKQIEAAVPSKKRAWQKVIRAKITAQADMLKVAGKRDEHLRRLVPLVRSGDIDNVEATAAARYFEILYGEDFLRDRQEAGLNSMLNYGYALIRASVARALVGAGLHPALGIHHRNQYNPFCLADDAMEPLRPMVDRIAWELMQADAVPEELYPHVKRKLINVLGGFIEFRGQKFPLLVGLERYAAGMRRAICDGEDLEVPLPVI